MTKPKKRRKRKPKTIGRMTQSRGDWNGINPVTKIKEGKKKRNERKEIKRKLKEGDFDG